MKFRDIIETVAKKGTNVSLSVPDRLIRLQLTDRFVKTIPYIFGVFVATNSTRVLLSNDSSIDIYDAGWVKQYENIKCETVDD